MTQLQYRTISADSHLEVSPDRWRPYVKKEYQDLAPRVVKLPGGGEGWTVPGSEEAVPLGLQFAAGMKHSEIRRTGVNYGDNPAGSGDSRQRLRELDTDGVDAEILYPAVMGGRSFDNVLPDRDAYLALIQAYNNWQSEEFCAAAPERLLGLALMPISGVEDAIAEYERVSRLKGIRGAVLSTWPNGTTLPAPPEDDRFWAAAVKLGFPLTAHIGFRSGRPATAPASGAVADLLYLAMLINRHGEAPGDIIAKLIVFGTFDRFPDLRIALAETGIGWVPSFMEQGDHNYTRHHFWAKCDARRLPSEYVRRHCLFGFQVDRVGLELRHRIGVENLMWATDFPHVETDWPESQQLIESQFAGVPEDEKHAMICGNAARFYHLAG